MAFVIAQACIGVKDTACVDVCPVDCIHALADSNQFFIDPVTCIDCGACEPACPVKAIFPVDQVPADQKKFIAINADFFKGFDKTKSAAYTRKKKEGASEAGAPAGEAKEGAATEAAAVDLTLKEVPGWEAQWEAHKDEQDDRTEIQKRYGRVRAVYEQEDKYIIRFYLPEVTPNHPFKFKYGFSPELPTYNLQAELVKNVVFVRGKIADPRFFKLCGHANSFPDSFYVEYPLSAKLASVSVQPKGTHVVDVVALKLTEEKRAA